MLFVCQHWDVQWIDEHTCSCNHCGKLGHWDEAGFVLWCRCPEAAELMANVA